MAKEAKYDFQLGPISMDKIEDHLYLGGLAAAKNVEFLRNYNITHILTIDVCPLPRTVTDQKGFVTKFVQLADLPKEDLLSHFDETDLFIKEGMTKGNVLVHCYFGVSRSASVVIAHIMKKHDINYFQAFDRVKSKRKIVNPNAGFVSQLKLYGEMGCQIDTQNMNYKMHKLNIAADKVRRIKVLPKEFHDLIQPDPNSDQSEQESNVYRCRKCRRILAGTSHLFTHQNNGKTCRDMYFLEPLAWMNVTEACQGTLSCPKCNSKLGSFSWISGCQCSCKTKVVPAFYLTPSKVDFSKIKKVEIIS